MKSIVEVYESHDKAVSVLQELKKYGYPDRLLSVIGKADLIDGHIQVKSNSADRAHLTIGIAAAAILEAVAIIGIFAVPGFGFIFGAGAAIGGFAGIDAALLAGGDVRAIFTNRNINDDVALEYEKRLIEGRFLVIADGDETQLEQAEKILHSQAAA